MKGWMEDLAEVGEGGGVVAQMHVNGVVAVRHWEGAEGRKEGNVLLGVLLSHLHVGEVM